MDNARRTVVAAFAVAVALVAGACGTTKGSTPVVGMPGKSPTPAAVNGADLYAQQKATREAQWKTAEDWCQASAKDQGVTVGDWYVVLSGLGDTWKCYPYQPSDPGVRVLRLGTDQQRQQAATDKATAQQAIAVQQAAANKAASDRAAAADKAAHDQAVVRAEADKASCEADTYTSYAHSASGQTFHYVWVPNSDTQGYCSYQPGT